VTPLLHTPPAELHDLAKRVVWFQPPTEALADRSRFLAYLMTYGTAEDVTIARRHFAPAEFREAIENAPPGIFDERSWAYWNLILGHYPAPPMPRRRLPE
jgi:hypothetical protein